MSSMLAWVRGQVSKKKKRLKDGHFDLDLSYITDHIIAMGYPAQGFEALYRNDFSEVREFLDERHGENYIVYNLCSERSYDADAFPCEVCAYPFDDHNPPAFDMIRQFCNHASAYLAESDQHVVAVHCKAGKGRTGVMICALLLHMHQFPNAEAALEFYGDKRTKNKKGVTIPSQRRYILYYQQYLDSHPDLTEEFHPRPYHVTEVRFEGLPAKRFTRKLTLEFALMENEGVEPPPGSLFPLEVRTRPDKDKVNHIIRFAVGGEVPEIVGDFRITLIFGKKVVCFMWFSSEYAKDGEDSFTKEEVDKASKGKSFDTTFKMIVVGTH
jgi:phosphatidylinositol-3,4,5-trisphosphate 3-phosphatase/dual-specificity protein phosphatase PTEN